MPNKPASSPENAKLAILVKGKDGKDAARREEAASLQKSKSELFADRAKNALCRPLSISLLHRCFIALHRCFMRDAIKARNDNLDIVWLRDTEAEAEEQLTEPEDIAAAIIRHLKAALEEIETLSEELDPSGIEKPAAMPEAAE